MERKMYTSTETKAQLQLPLTATPLNEREYTSEDSSRSQALEMVVYLEDGIRTQLLAEIDPLELAKEIFFHRVANGVGSKGLLQLVSVTPNRRIMVARLVTAAQLTLRITMVPLKRDLSRVGYFVAAFNYRHQGEDTIAGQAFEEEVTLRADMIRGEFK